MFDWMFDIIGTEPMRTAQRSVPATLCLPVGRGSDPSGW